MIQRLACLKFGSCGTLTLQGFAIGSAAEESKAEEEASAVAGDAELVDGGSEDEEDAGEVGFRFGDGYDLAAFEAGLCEGLLEGVSDEAVS